MKIQEQKAILRIINESCPTFFLPMGYKLSEAVKMREHIEGNYGHELRAAIYENISAYLERKPDWAYNPKLIKGILKVGG